MNANDLATILANHERLLRSDQQILDMLEVLIRMLAVGIGLGVVILIAQIGTLISKWHIRAEMIRLLNRAIEHHEDTADLLKIVKEWANSARTHSKDSKEILKEVKEQASHATVEEVDIARDVKEIPDKTADRVIERIRSGDSVTPEMLSKEKEREARRT
jgi:hypothetical protein